MADIVSLFSGCGGMDLGFEQAGFNIVFANEFDKTIWDTYEKNHNVQLNKNDIRKIESKDIPDCDGLIGGPPCQSWSEAGSKKGIEDLRGQLFYEYIRILQDKKPKFFVAENVSGMLAKRHSEAVENIKNLFVKAGYNLFVTLVDVADYGIPQNRKRVFYIGIRNDIDVKFTFPSSEGYNKKTLKDTIDDLKDTAVPALDKNHHNPSAKNAHEYYIGGFSPIYMSRNRKRDWNEQGFTVQASGRQAQLHPSSPDMEYVQKDLFKFKEGKENFYRRMSIRECARIQTFPDDFEFVYTYVNDGYKMVGNAVPVEMARIIAEGLKVQLDL